MKPTFAQQIDFLANRPIAGVAFALNDYITVTAGAFAGESGSVVSIAALGADPMYLMRLESGKHAFIAQSSLQAEGDS